MRASRIRDVELYRSGAQKIDWVKRNMPLLRELEEEFSASQCFQGINISMSIHLEAKTAYLALVLQAGGAQMAVTGSNPLSTKDDVAAALVKEGVSVYAWYNASTEEYLEHIDDTLQQKPQLIIDDGGDLIQLITSKRRELIPAIIGGCEETTTGVLRLKAREREGELPFPMVAVNDAYCKYLFDNRYGTGQSVWDAINRTTNLVVSGKQAVIIGYGWCGKGCAMRARGLGAQVIICEVNPVRALEAVMDGYQVMTMEEAAQVGDLFITVTGCRDAIRREHFLLMKEGALLANAGHFDVEINLEDLRELAVTEQEIRENIRGFQRPDGGWLYLLGEGRLVNLAAGDGHPAEIMDLSFALQALTARYLLEEGEGLEKKVYPVPEVIDETVAAMKLKALHIQLDSLTSEQQAYLRSWK